MSIKDTSLLHKYPSAMKGSVFHSNKREVKMEGYQLESLKDYIENNFKVLVEIDDDQNEDFKFDFTLPIKSFEEFKAALLEDYGISLTSAKKKITFYEVKKNK